MPRAPQKSQQKSLSGVAAVPTLRGRGPKKGAPNAGRPASAVRAAMRNAFADRLHVLTAIADDETRPAYDRLRALDLLAKYGLGTTITETDTEGKDVPRSVILVPGMVDAAAWTLTAQQQQQTLELQVRGLVAAVSGAPG